jgi:tRNA-specific 2-thiouridylase
MSGGVDSSVAAALLLEQGFDVVGVFMRLGSPGEALDELQPAQEVCRATPGASGDGKTRSLKIGHQGCCSINDAADARLVAAQLGIPFYVVNFKKDFGRIIDYFVDEYAAGRTPNPCVRCNDWLKFGKLREYAGQIGADYVASGHYAQVEGGRLLRGIDQDKDQSYVLFGVPREHLRHMLLPIGGMHKSAVREKARALGLPVFDKPDSQEICFVPDNDYAGLIERRRPELARAGAILDAAGNRVGEHRGQHRFTLGQRRGVGVALGLPVYVVGKDPETNTVTIGSPELLLSSNCTVSEANWLVDVDAHPTWRPCLAKYRYNSRAIAARLRLLEDGGSATPSGRAGRFEVRFEEPQSAVTPGQALVVYDATDARVVLGGGWIGEGTPAVA